MLLRRSSMRTGTKDPITIVRRALLGIALFLPLGLLAMEEIAEALKALGYTFLPAQYERPRRSAQ